jgi:hypothetical protein
MKVLGHLSITQVFKLGKMLYIWLPLLRVAVHNNSRIIFEIILLDDLNLVVKPTFTYNENSLLHPPGRFLTSGWISKSNFAGAVGHFQNFWV